MVAKSNALAEFFGNQCKSEWEKRGRERRALEYIIHTFIGWGKIQKKLFEGLTTEIWKVLKIKKNGYCVCVDYFSKNI